MKQIEEPEAMKTEQNMRGMELSALLVSEAREGEHPLATFCRVRNRAFNAPPGIVLPEAAAAAMGDFLAIATYQLQDA